MSTAEPGFRRGWHLAFALAALVHAPIAAGIDHVLPSIVGAYPWTAEIDTLSRLIPLCFAAFVAWFAFEGIDTRSGVTLLPRRWRDVGVLVAVVYLAAELGQVALLLSKSAADIDRLVERWAYPYFGSEGELLLGWLVVAKLAVALAEELVYRALLLRALEGYVSARAALVGQALVFELVHLFVYGHQFQGGWWLFLGLLYGYAFQRTRSVAVPVLLHATANIVFVVLLWALAT